MGSKNSTSSKLDVDIEKLIVEGSEKTTMVSTISESKKQALKKDNDYIEVLAIWKKEKRTEQVMKIVLCSCLGALLVAQVICINIIIFKIGLKQMQFDEWTIRIFVSGVFAEIIALVKIIVNNLFPKSGNRDFMEFINNLYVTRTRPEKNQENPYKKSV